MKEWVYCNPKPTTEDELWDRIQHVAEHLEPEIVKKVMRDAWWSGNGQGSASGNKGFTQSELPSLPLDLNLWYICAKFLFGNKFSHVFR